MARGEQLDRQILDAVARTLYTEGINSTGVDRLSHAAGVSKRTIYQRFSSKDVLIERALDAMDEPVYELVIAAGRSAEAAGKPPREQILAVFEDLDRRAADPGFRGCPFLNAGVELVDPSHPAHSVVRRHKDRVRRWFETTAAAGELDRPAELAQELMLLYDGALIGGLVGSAPSNPMRTRHAARTLLDAAHREP
jgi:AcrR family transcriptional regulator